jgi:DNA-binding CsgD family transcriptional regulator
MTAAMSNQDLSHLIGRIYDCVLDPLCWEATLADAVDLLCCHGAVLHLSDLRHNRLLMHKEVGLDACWLEKVDRYLPDMHSLMPSEPILDEPHVLSRHVDRAIVDVSPYVQNWLRPQGIIDVAQLFALHTSSRLSGLGLSRHESVGVFRDRELHMMRLLLPHVRRAVTISNVLDVQTIEKARMIEALNALKVGVVLANANSRIVHANRAAEKMMRDGGPLRDRGGLLLANGRAASAEISAAIGHAARNESEIGKTGLAVRLTGEDEAPIVAHVLPLAGGEVRTRLEPAAVAAVFVNPEVDDAANAKVVASTFKLTPAETRVLRCVLSGKTLAEAAAELDVATSTARTHLDNIFLKTGVSRQSELIRMVAKIAPAGL